MIKFKFLLCLVICWPLASFSKARTESDCKELLKVGGFSTQPIKRDTFTQMPPVCAKAVSGSIALKADMVVNKRDQSDLRADQVMVSSMISTLPKILCRQKEIIALLKEIDFIYQFRSHEGAEMGSLTLTERSCQEQASAEIDMGGEMTLATCEGIANTNKKMFPRKIGDEFLRVDLFCRKGTTKTAALVQVEEVLLDQKGASLQAVIRSEGFQNIVKQNYCKNPITKSLLASMDLVNLYRLKGDDLGEVITTQRDCI